MGLAYGGVAQQLVYLCDHFLTCIIRNNLKYVIYCSYGQIISMDHASKLTSRVLHVVIGTKDVYNDFDVLALFAPLLLGLIIVHAMMGFGTSRAAIGNLLDITSTCFILLNFGYFDSKDRDIPEDFVPSIMWLK